jgi:glucose dehydrogenase
LWKFDLKTVSPSGRYSPRGISYWPGDAQTPPRVVATTTDGLLTQVNAKNGELVRLGDKGYVDLKTGMTEKFGGGYNVARLPPSSGTRRFLRRRRASKAATESPAIFAASI